jgi:hypothetical protein
VELSARLVEKHCAAPAAHVAPDGVHAAKAARAACWQECERLAAVPTPRRIAGALAVLVRPFVANAIERAVCIGQTVGRRPMEAAGGGARFVAWPPLVCVDDRVAARVGGVHEALASRPPREWRHAMIAVRSTAGEALGGVGTAAEILDNVCVRCWWWP